MIRILGTAIALVIVGLLTRYLGQSGFGDYATLLAFLYIFMVLADFGLYSITVREISKPGADEQRIASAALTLRALIGIIVFGLACLIVQFLPYSGQLKIGLVLGAIGFWFLSNNQVLMGIFQKHLRTDLAGLGEIAGRILQLGLVILFVKLNAGFLSIVLALSVGGFLNFLVVFLFACRYVRLRISFDFSLWKKILRAGLPLAMAAFLVMIYFRLDTVMLSLMKGSSEVGIYGLGYKVLEGIIFFPAMFVGLVMPLMSKFFSLSKKFFLSIIQKTLDVLLIFAVPMIVGTIFLSKKIIILIGGRDFILSSGVLNILIFACGIIFLGALFSNAIIAVEKQKALAWIYGLGALVNIVTNFIFIPKYSYYGAAWTTVLTEFLVTFLMVLILHQTIRRWFSFKILLRILPSAFLMGGSLYFLKSSGLIVLVLIGALIYFAALYLFRGFSVKELKKLCAI